MKKPSSDARDYTSESRSCRVLDPHVPHRHQIESEHVGGQRLAAIASLLVNVTESERNRIVSPDEGPSVFDVGQERRSVAGREREIHRGRLAVGIGLGLIEVRVAVDKEQTKSSVALERQRRSQQD